MKVHIIGGGLAGSEAAWQVAEAGFEVHLSEMRPLRSTPAHRTGFLAELVCSNSLKSNALDSASGLLKEEMRRMGSLLMKTAAEASLPAGSCLAVDRHHFASSVTAQLEAHPLVRIVREEVTSLPAEGPTILASGPLTSPGLTEAVRSLIEETISDVSPGDSSSGKQGLLSFYDAISPIVLSEGLDHSQLFRASRYGRGEDYLNAPLTPEDYDRLREELIRAPRAEARDFEEIPFFEGCLPVEELAVRGRDTLRFGPLKPVGLIDPATGRRPWAVVQLRQENREASMYNLVGFQTRIRWGEQKRIFRQIPGLQEAEFCRYGSIHRNTFLNAPTLLKPTLQWKGRPYLLVAGQLTGVEGYVESAATGLLAGLSAVRLLKGEVPEDPPSETALGSLVRYLTEADPRHFQPMHINIGLLPPLEEGRKVPSREKRAKVAQRSLAALEAWRSSCGD